MVPRAESGPSRFGSRATSADGRSTTAGSFVALTELVEDRRQAAALDKLHGVVVNALVAADAEDRHDVRVVQLRGGLGLDLEPLPLLGVDRRGERQHLQGNAPAQRDLLGLVDDAHAPPADLAEDAVFAQLGARRDGVGRIGGRKELANRRAAGRRPE